MTTTKQRLESKIEKTCNEYVEQRFMDSCDDGDRMIARIASKYSANEILAPLLLEMVESMQSIKNNTEDINLKYVVDISLKKFDEFLN
jgi:hypothetical protein